MDSCHLPPLFCSLRGRRLGPHEQPWKLHHRQPVTANHLRPLHPQRAAHRPSLGPLRGSPSSTDRLVPGRPIPAAKLGHMLQLLGVWAREMPPPSLPLGTECRAPPEHREGFHCARSLFTYPDPHANNTGCTGKVLPIPHRRKLRLRQRKTREEVVARGQQVMGDLCPASLLH